MPYYDNYAPARRGNSSIFVLIDTLYHAIESKTAHFDSVIPVLLRFQTISEHKKRAPERNAPAILMYDPF